MNGPAAFDPMKSGSERNGIKYMKTWGLRFERIFFYVSIDKTRFFGLREGVKFIFSIDSTDERERSEDFEDALVDSWDIELMMTNG